MWDYCHSSNSTYLNLALRAITNPVGNAKQSTSSWCGNVCTAMYKAALTKLPGVAKAKVGSSSTISREERGGVACARTPLGFPAQLLQPTGNRAPRAQFAK